MRVGAVSDIHGGYTQLERAVEAMGAIDLLLHAGDGCNEVRDWQRRHRRVRVEMVAGNCDLFVACPDELTLRLDRWKVLLTHGHLYAAKAGFGRLLARARDLDVELVVFGHTHRAIKMEYHGIILLNPGSLSPVRCLGKLSYAVIDAVPEGLTIDIHCL